MRLPSTGQNTGVQKPIGSTAASVNIPVHRRNTAGPYISLPTTIQDRIFQGIVPAMSNVYVHFSQISFPAQFSVGISFIEIPRSYYSPFLWIWTII